MATETADCGKYTRTKNLISRIEFKAFVHLMFYYACISIVIFAFLFRSLLLLSKWNGYFQMLNHSRRLTIWKTIAMAKMLKTIESRIQYYYVIIITFESSLWERYQISIQLKHKINQTLLFASKMNGRTVDKWTNEWMKERTNQSYKSGQSTVFTNGMSFRILLCNMRTYYTI